MTLVEIMVSLTILTLSAGAIVSTLIAARGLSDVTDERAIAREAVDGMLERLMTEDFSQVFAIYNADPTDDPEGPGTAWGPAFDAGPLRAVQGDPDGRVGEVLFPVVAGALREDVENERLGMPRDLNLDRDTDALDHADDYRILPLTVRVTWRGSGGVHELFQDFVLGDLQ